MSWEKKIERSLFQTFWKPHWCAKFSIYWVRDFKFWLLYGLCQRWWYTGPLLGIFKSTLPLYFTISDIVHDFLILVNFAKYEPDWINLIYSLLKSLILTLLDLDSNFKALHQADLQLVNPGTDKAYISSIFIETTHFLVKADINHHFLTLFSISWG